MHDIRAIRENPASFDAALGRRGLPAMSPAILSLDEARRAAILAAETAQAARFESGCNIVVEHVGYPGRVGVG